MSSSPANVQASSAETARSLPLARPELLAPAGDWECVRAAVENGADAIYFGLERFNARMRAKNFTQADLPELMAFLHRRGVRGYVTFNVLVFPGELADAADFLRSIIAAGVDAAIVQDIGICRLIRRLSPDFPIHGSTQMTVTGPAGVNFARDLGAELVVLGRENSIKEINEIQAAQLASGLTPLPLEVFVHGALCVAYSGQCLTSESLGGRSANRGECAQACRMPYDLYSDGEKVDLGDRKYLLSPQDLAGLDVLPELVKSGVASLKIEGRLKSPEYVASITRVYRQALDKIFAETIAPQTKSNPLGYSSRPLSPEENPSKSNLMGYSLTGAADEVARAKYELSMTFSRGLYTGWFNGINNQELAHGRFGTKRGVLLGEISHVGTDHVLLKLISPLKPGDGVVFDAGNHAAGEEGGRVYQVEPQRDGTTRLRFGHGDLNFRKIHVGDKLWKNNDPALDRELRATFEGEKLRHTRPINAEVHGRAGQPLTLLLDDGHGHHVKAESEINLEPAQKRPLTTEILRDQIGRLGGTPFHLGELRVHLEGELMLPVSELNRLRRDAAAKLDELRAAPRRWTLYSESEGRAGPPGPPERLTTTIDAATGTTSNAAGPAVPPYPEIAPHLVLVVRNLQQLDTVLTCPGTREVYCEFENPKHYREAVQKFRAWQTSDFLLQTSDLSTALAPSIWLAPPRVFKPGEEWILKQVASAEPDGYLVRNHEHLRFYAGSRLRGDFSLNAANPLTAEYLLSNYNLERITASYDLNVHQLESLLKSAPPAWFDLTLHQHMPMFHMEHCVFCAFLSKGKDYHDCGRPCEKHAVHLKDRVGAEFPLKADAGCRNTVYNNRAQTGAEFAARLLELGAKHFRVEFMNEGPDEVRKTVDYYQKLLRGELDGTSLWKELKLINQMGVTRGQLDAAPRVIFKKS